MMTNKGTNGAGRDGLDADQTRMKSTAAELERMIVDGKFVEAFEGAASFHAKYPNSGPANIVYGLAALLTDHIDEAEKAAQLLSKLPEGDFMIILEYWANQLSAHQRMGMAYMVGLKMLSLSSAEPRHFRSCAQVGVDNGDLEGLEEILRGWSWKFPDDLGVYRYRAQLLTARGDLEGAREAARKALQSKPDYGAALRSLADLDSSLVDDEEIKNARSRKAAAKDFEQAYMGFALGKIFEDRGENDEAFAEYAAANAALKKHFAEMGKGYDHEGMITYYDYIKDHTGAGNLGDTGGATDWPLPIFIVGLPSSGTTVMEQILSMHGKVQALGERTAMGEMLATVIQKKRSGEWLGGIPSEDASSLREFYFSGLDEEIEGCTAVTDKMPGNFAAIGLVKDIFPEARILHMTRDPQDNCISIFTRFFSAGGFYTVDLESIGKNYTLYRSMMAHWQKIYGSGILDVPYEALVEDLEAKVRQVLGYCDLDYDANCLDFESGKNPVATMSTGQVRRPLLKTSIGRWKKFEKHLGPLMDALES